MIMLWRWFFKWRYYRRRRRRSRDALAGTRCTSPQFSIFRKGVFTQARFGKYESTPVRAVWRVIVLLLLAVFCVWFAIESIQAINIFQRS